MDYAKLIAIILLLILIFALWLYDFSRKSKEQKIETLIHWLRKAVYYAEKELGSGTGQLKLATVYGQAVEKFPWIAELYSYEKFDTELVQPALDWLNKQMANNDNIKKLLGI